MKMKRDINIDFENTCGDLVKGGASSFVIVTPPAGAFAPAIQRAALYIREYVCLATGVTLPIVVDTERAFKEARYISVGKTVLQEKNGVAFDYSALAHDGFFIKTDRENVYIDGVSGRGILYGAIDFLERVVGVKFLAYDDIFVPKADKIALPSLSIIDNPDFTDRCFSHAKTMNDPKFMAQMRMINEYVDFPEEYGGNIGWFFDKAYVRNAVHNTFDYVDADVYYKTHPEWFFAEKDWPIDLDYSHVGLNEDGSIDESLEISPVKLAADKMFEIIAHAAPSIKYFQIGQMDYTYNCSCPDCLEQERKFGRSGMLIRFVNAVARNVRERLKQAGIKREYFISTFAYQWSQSAPVARENGKIVPKHPSVIPEDDVLIRICSIKANQYYSVLDEKQLPATKAMFEEWAVILENRATMIWSYHSRFTYPFCFFPTMQHWLNDFKVYHKIGCEYLFMQVNHFEPNDWKATMETFVAARLMWDNNLDPYALRKEYISLYYGALSRLVTEFVDNYEKLFADLMEKEDCPNMALQGLDSIVLAKWYPVAFWKKQFALLEKMYALANELTGEAREKMLVKVDRIKLTPLATIIYKFEDYDFGQELVLDKTAMINEFFSLCDKLGVKMAGEWQTLDQLKQAWGYTKA